MADGLQPLKHPLDFLLFFRTDELVAGRLQAFEFRRGRLAPELAIRNAVEQRAAGMAAQMWRAQRAEARGEFAGLRNRGAIGLPCLGRSCRRLFASR